MKIWQFALIMGQIDIVGSFAAPFLGLKLIFAGANIFWIGVACYDLIKESRK